MEENKEKLTYEQLEEVCKQLSNQNNQLYAKLQELSMVTTFKRLDYLFKVVENDVSFDEEFVGKCIDEIKDIMTPQNLPETEIAEEEK